MIVRITGLLLSLGAACTAATVGDGLVRLENAQVVVEVLPRLGGRITTLRRPGGENVIASVPALLASAVETLPQAGVEGPYLHALGHVIWIGPQRDWWTQQDANPARRDARATWPPDPWLEYGPMEVAERDAAHLVLVGQPSAVSGLAMRLRIGIEADGSVVQAIEARNAGPRAVAWDLWPNTRVRGDARVFAPYEPGTRLRIEHATWDPRAELQLPAAVVDGYLSFDTALPPASAHLLHTGKAFIQAARPHLFAASGRELLIVAAASAGVAEVHPDHTPVEVFQCVGGDPVRTVLEYEFHSAYRTLEPGASLRFAVAWRIVPLASCDAAGVSAHEQEAARLGLLADAAAR